MLHVTANPVLPLREKCNRAEQLCETEDIRGNVKSRHEQNHGYSKEQER